MHELILKRLSWRSKGIIDSKKDSLCSNSDMPDLYWSNDDEKGSRHRRLALKILGTSTSSPGGERNFNNQDRMQNAVGNRLMMKR